MMLTLFNLSAFLSCRVKFFRHDDGAARFLIDRPVAFYGPISTLIVDNIPLDDFTEGGQPCGWSLTSLP